MIRMVILDFFVTENKNNKHESGKNRDSKTWVEIGREVIKGN